jgi:hypothetical protein
MAAKKVLTKIGDQVSIHIYDNGFMIEASGKDVNGDWKTVRNVCKDADELFGLVKQYISMERDDD